MSITVDSFGKTKDGKEINLYTITNENGAVLKLTDMGAVWVSIIVPDQNGNMDDVVLGLDSGEEYEQKNYVVMGAVIGRNANRIEGHKFTLNGREYILEDNNRGSNLHSGNNYYFTRLWDAEPVVTDIGEGVEFSLFSPHMDQGYPGNLTVTVSYILTEDNSVIIEYSGISDEDTVVNMTNHAYFNLGGHKSGNIEDHLVWIDADNFTYGTDEVYPVLGTPLDFRQLKRIGDEINADSEFISKGGGYDHNFCLKTNGTDVELVAKLVDEKSGRVMDVFTNMPGMQLYSGNFIWDGNKGKDGATYHPREGVAFETQFYPDSVNRPQFPSPIVKGGEPFYYSTVYRFSVIE